MTGVALSGIYKRYPRSMTGWSAVRRLWELFQPPERIEHVTDAQLGDGRYLWALRDVNLSIGRGEVVGLVGPNGSGKSSLLKIVAGITPPTAGRVEASGRVGTLIEIGAGFHPEMTGRENVFLNGSILGLARREIQRHFDEIVSFAELEQFIDLPVKKYSSGMYVRLGFSVATMVPPDVLLVDEILSVGDLAFQRKSIARMRELKRGDTTILFVSHNMDAVRHFCGRGIFLLGGRVAYDGSADGAIEQYYRHAQRSPIAFWPTAEESLGAAPALATITSVALSIDNGVRPECLAPGQPFRLRIEYGSRAPLGAVHVAIAIYDADGALVSQFSTHGDGVSLGALDGSGAVTVLFPSGLPLARGTVRFAVSIMDEDCLESYAAKENAAEVSIGSDRAESGGLYTPRQWLKERS